jgi:soluble lytic murein transglycosylase-like protein
MRTLAIMTMVATASVGAAVAIASPILVPLPALQVYGATPLTAADVHHSMDLEKQAARIRMNERIAHIFYEAHGCYDDTLDNLTARKSLEHGVPVRLLSSLIFTESRCRPNAKSDRAACGLMQVNSKAWHVSCQKLLDPETGVEIGTRIFASYQRQFGLRGGLQHYLGMGTDDGNMTGNEYADKVLTTAGYHPETIQ